MGAYPSTATLEGPTIDGSTNTPARPYERMRYGLPRPALVQLTVYDIPGREVATLVNEQRPAGVHSLNFDASLLPGGLYFARLIGGGAVHIRKMLLLR